jgi:diguanylate cyclase (GGDEF)-like protein/PAS domain S-box-containing protein
MMPGIDGFEVIRRVRQEDTHRLLPIILVTALRETKDRVKGIEAGCDDFISKPIDKAELLARVRSLLKLKAYNDLMSNYRKELEVTKISADEAREYAESIINTVREPLIALDQDLRVVKVSRSFYDVFKVKPEETMGQLIYDLGNKQWDIPKLRDLLEDILPKKVSFDNYEVEHNFATIGRRIMLLNARQIQRASGKERIILLAIEDITERKQSEEKIQQMAYHDSLTGLPNRKLFSDRLGIALIHAQRNQKKVGIAMLDLDNFKDVNDTLGHDAGDILLKAAAMRLSAELRKVDTVARFGGDEFVLILPDLKVIEDAIPVAQKIVDSFRKSFLIDTNQFIVTMSIGIAVYPNDGTDEAMLLKNADIAMYQAKQAGRDRYQLCKKA